MNKNISWVDWFNRYYLLCMVPVAVLVFYYNFYAQAMFGLLVSYQAFADVIKSGFDTSATSYYPLTFPIWGYGFLMALTNSNHIALILIQLILAFLSVWYLIKTIEQYNLLTHTAIIFFKFLLLISIPWYAFHTVRWPYSIASSLLVISLCLLYRGTQEQSWISYIALSGIAFGLLLNFRSDYILMPIGLAVISILFLPTLKAVKKTVLWLAFIYSCLIPWALFTHKVCGHYLLTSTNGGHQCLTGLGDYEKNLWGIAHTNGDNCPVIHGFVDEVYGKNSATWDYQGDLLLKKKYFELISSNPLHYAKRTLLNIPKVPLQGVYNGEFFMQKNLLRNPNFTLGTLSLIKKTDNPIKTFITLLGIKLQNYSYWIANYFTLSCYIILPALCLSLLFTPNLFIALTIATILYQTALNIFMHHYTAYTSNIFILLLLLLPYCLTLLIKHKENVYETSYS